MASKLQAYAQIKALCAGNPLIKEKMDLDIDVARLRLLKSDHQSHQYRMEDDLLKRLQRLTKGNMINNNKMDCQPYRKRRPAVKRAAFLRDRERRKTYKETGPK